MMFCNFIRNYSLKMVARKGLNVLKLVSTTFLPLTFRPSYIMRRDSMACKVWLINAMIFSGVACLMRLIR